MKRIILMLIVAISLGSLSAQEMTLRLEMPATAPNPGEEFFVEVWMDVLDYPGYTLNGGVPTLKSGQMGVWFDPAVLTPLKTPGAPAIQKYAWNVDQMFLDYNAVPNEGYPEPGDLRFVSFTTLAPGMDPQWYGTGSMPYHMWDLKFEYAIGGGDIEITWQDVDVTTKVQSNLSGGVKEKIVTKWTAWDDAEYAMTYINIEAATGDQTDWTGAADEVWNNPGNWTNGVPTGLPDQTVVINETGKAAPTIYTSAVAGVLNLIAGQLSIAPGGSLTTTGLFTNGGTLYMSSDAAGVSASFVDQGGLAGTGTFQYDRDVFSSGAVGGSSNTFGWHYLSTPITDPVTPNNGFTTDDLPDYFVNAWDETASSWIQYSMDPYAFPCTPWATTALNPMDAWSINSDLNYPDPLCPGLPAGTGNIVEFSGPFTNLHTGLQSAAATVSAGAFAGWNMFGNPYASSIDPSVFPWGVFDAVQGAAIWDGASGNYLYSASGNSYPYNVGPTQGFFVLALSPGTFALSGAERVHDNTQTIWKDDITGLVTIEATGNETSDLTYIRFMEGTQAGMDVHDFPKLFSVTEGLAQIYTTAQGDDLAVNALPATPVVPMGFTSVTSGEYTISAIETSDFTNVVLEDRFTGEQTDLLTGSYTFNYTVNDDADRFFVHFTPLGIGDNLANSIDIWSNDHKIYVQAPAINGDIVVFNMMGQEVIRTEIEPGLNTIPVNDRNSYYVVKVVSSDVARTGKVYVK